MKNSEINRKERLKRVQNHIPVCMILGAFQSYEAHRNQQQQVHIACKTRNPASRLGFICNRRKTVKSKRETARVRA